MSVARRPVAQKASEVREQILGQAIKEHPLYPIVSYIISDMVDHAEAIDRIGKRRPMLLHVRHIEEVYTIAKYLMNEKDRHQEFAWRWASFAQLHRIRNRLLTLKQPLDEEMAAFLRANIDHMKAYLHKKFDLDEAKCREQWARLTNWMMDIPLKEVFEKAGRLDSYVSAAYDWSSQSVHLSPMGDTYMSYKLEHFDFGDFALDSAQTWIHKMCHECEPLVSKPEVLRDYYFRQVMLETLEMLAARPAQYLSLAKKRPQFNALTQLLLQKPFDVELIRNAAIGAPPQDPYLLELTSGGEPAPVVI